MRALRRKVTRTLIKLNPSRLRFFAPQYSSVSYFALSTVIDARMFKNVSYFLKKISNIFTNPPNSLRRNPHFPIYPFSPPSRIYSAVVVIFRRYI
jgi:hypothetical protein